MNNNETNNHLHQMRSLLEQAKKHFKPEKEKTFFDIGLRGHYENPTTELLAFYLNPNNCHGLEQAFLNGLLKAANIDIEEFGNFESIEREHSLDGGRIDLLLTGEMGVIAIECKIFAYQNNPFKAYEEYIERSFSYEKHKHFIVLSIDGNCQENGWQGLSYAEFINATKPYLGEKLINNQLNKWAVLALDLIAHLENLKEDVMNQETFKFIQENLQDIRKLAAMENNFYSSIHNKIKEAFKKQDILMKVQTWPDDTKTLRFSIYGQQAQNDCTLQITPGNYPKVKVYTYIQENRNKSEFIHIFKNDLKVTLTNFNKINEGWENEAKKDWWHGGWEEPMDLDEAIKRVVIILNILDKIDKTQRELSTR